jgi:folate-binding protein YgfZ
VVIGEGGRWCGFDAAEARRIELGIPRFGVDMDDSNLAPEAGIERRAICYNKGCYIGQEVIARIRTYGQVAKVLRRLRWMGGSRPPGRGDRLLREGKEVGYITSAVHGADGVGGPALGYVRRELKAAGTELDVGVSGPGGCRATVL